MPIDPEAIARYLDKPLPKLPRFKGADPQKLHDLIYRVTGAHLKPKIPTLKAIQLEGIAFALYLRNALMLYDMRLGKTGLSITWAEHLRRCNFWRPGKKGLIIAHAPLGLSIWEEQIPMFSDLTARYVQSSQDEFLDALTSDCDFIVVPWTGLQEIFGMRKLNQKGVVKMYPNRAACKIAAEFFSLVIMDEIHRVKNPANLWFQIIEALTPNCKFRMGLTGTPVGRNPFALWAEAYLIDRGEALGYRYNFFKQIFGKEVKSRFSPYPQWVFDKEKMLLLQQRVDTLALSYTRDEVRKMQVIAKRVKVPMSRLQEKAYNEAVDTMQRYHRGDDVKLENAFTRTRQIASGWVPFIGPAGDAQIMTFPNSGKLQWLREFLPCLPPKTQVVIFHEFTHSGQLICNLLQEMGITHRRIRGKQRHKNREYVRAFQTRRFNVLVANTATGGTGIDLSGVSYMCFYESPVDPITRQQAEARPLADSRGDRPLWMDDLISAPVERKILTFIREGKNLSKVIRGNVGDLKTLK